MENADEQIRILRDYATTLQARSLAGALFQLNLLFLIVNLMEATVAADNEVENSDMRKIRRLFFSIRPLLANAVPPALLDRIEFEDQHMDPWKSADECLAIIADRHGEKQAAA